MAFALPPGMAKDHTFSPFLFRNPSLRYGYGYKCFEENTSATGRAYPPKARQCRTATKKGRRNWNVMLMVIDMVMQMEDTLQCNKPLTKILENSSTMNLNQSVIPVLRNIPKTA